MSVSVKRVSLVLLDLVERVKDQDEEIKEDSQKQRIESNNATISSL